MLDVGVVLPAGGRGARMGGGELKQFRNIGGVPMLLRTVRRFVSLPRVVEIVVPVPADICDAPPEWLAEMRGGRVRLVPGGATRAESVRNGVAALSSRVGVVLVHDAARPFVTTETIEAILAAVDTGTCAIAAVPVSDTIKRSTSDGLIAETLDRSRLWRAQTPQGFPRALLDRAYAELGNALADPTLTDESAIAERVGAPVALIADSTTNIKITTGADFAIAEVLATP